MEYKTEYLSLYDFLKKPAGEKLGAEVAAEARKQGIQTQTRQISNPRFEGIVLLYPRDFLEFYFREPDFNLPEGHDWMGNLEDDDLPF
jgi:hypothetical protein